VLIIALAYVELTPDVSWWSTQDVDDDAGTITDIDVDVPNAAGKPNFVFILVRRDKR
jgi:hypothetical protein